MSTEQKTITLRYAGRIAPPAKLDKALQQIEGNDDVLLPRRSAYAFPWFDEANQRETLDYLIGMKLATDQHLYHQIAYYQQQVVKWVTKDMADRVRSLVATEFGYSGNCYYHPGYSPVPERDAFHAGSWTYHRIEDFGGLIPPQALAGRALLERAGILPQAYWVAQKRADPILTAQFGRWFVAVYEWE